MTSRMTARKTISPSVEEDSQQTLAQTIIDYIKPWVEFVPGASYLLGNKVEQEEKKEETIHDVILRLAGLDVDEAENALTDILVQCSKDLPAVEKDRLSLYFKLNTFQARIDSCTFLTQFERIRLLTSKEKSSASESWVALALLDSQPVALKISFTSTGAKGYVDNSLEVERLIYRKIVNPLLLCGQTPHVLVYYTELECPGFIQSLRSQTSNDAMTLLKDLKKSFYDGASFNFDEMHASVIERAVGKTVNETFARFQDRFAANESYVFSAVFLPILFQIFYTLVVFTDIGLVHNDLHSGNVFVEIYPRTITSRYLVGGKLYEIASQFQSRFFDFDRSAKLATTYNPIVIENDKLTLGKFCEDFGQCPDLNERSDIYTLVYFIYQITTNSVLQAFLKKIVPIEFLKRDNFDASNPKKPTPGSTLAFPGRLCACKNKLCDGCIPIMDRKILTPRQALALPEFDQFVVTDKSSTFVWAPPSEKL